MSKQKRRSPPSREEKAKQEKLVVRLLKKGSTAAEVARDERVALHPTTVRRLAKKHDIVLECPYNRHQDRDDLIDVKEILRLRKQTRKTGSKKRPVFTLQEIADLCKCSRSYVKQVCAKARSEGRL